MITHIEAAMQVASYLQDTRTIVGNVHCSQETAFGYDRIWDWVKESLQTIEDLLYEFLADYKDLMD